MREIFKIQRNTSNESKLAEAISSISNKYFTYVGSDDALIYNKESIDKIFLNDNVDCFFGINILTFGKAHL